MGLEDSDNSRASEIDSIRQMARTYRLWAVILGVLVFLELMIGSQGAHSNIEIVIAFMAGVVGFAPMLCVACGLRHGFSWSLKAAYALPVCQAVGAASLIYHGGPASELSGLGIFVRYIIAVSLYQCPVTIILAIKVLHRSESRR